MNTFDDILNNTPAEERPQLSKEEYAEKKKSERDAIFELSDNTALEVACDGGIFEQYLDVQSKFTRYSAVNALLIMAQNPDATRVGDFEYWKEKGGYQSPLDELFDRLEMREPEHIALKYYHNYRSGSAKTLKSIQLTLAARLEKFNLESLSALSVTDELDLTSLGEKKTALFIIIPDNDSSFNFLVSILYTQLFQQLFYSADHKHGGALPVHVHFLMDEFANATQFLR